MILSTSAITSIYACLLQGPSHSASLPRLGLKRDFPRVSFPFPSRKPKPNYCNVAETLMGEYTGVDR